MSKETEKDYEPFGDEWHKEVSKMPKAMLIEQWAASCQKRQELEQRLAASTPVNRGEQKSKEVLELLKYVEDSINESESIYGPIEKISQYGGSAFAIWRGKECYRLQWQSYNQAVVTLDAAEPSPVIEDKQEVLSESAYVTNMEAIYKVVMEFNVSEPHRTMIHQLCKDAFNGKIFKLK